jgi:hypothetical protein
MEVENALEKDAPVVRKGRPPKAAIQEKKKRGQVGRPAGDSARIAEFKARLLSTTGQKVIDKILQTALEDGHPAQGACMKMCFDRLLPVSMFDKEANGGSGKASITINIAGLNDSVSIQSSDFSASSDDVEDGEWTE